MIVAIINPLNRDFYTRTKEDQEIIANLIFKRANELGRSDETKQPNIKAWAHAYNNFFKDYSHTLEWLSELKRNGSLSIRTG